MSFTKFSKTVLLTAVFAWVAGGIGRAQTATNITGLYYTGVTSNGGALQTQGTQDPNWTVSYASTDGGSSENSTYEGSAYVLSSSYIATTYVQNTTAAQWVTAPGASTAETGGTTNIGGDYLPGNGNSGGNEGIYAYTLAFNIVGTGSGITNSQISISLTIAADDQYQVYINPRGINGGGGARNPLHKNPSTYSAQIAGSATSAWTNTTSITLDNYILNNSVFVIGTNYLTVVVDNTNSITGSSGSTALNPSGLYVYQVGSAMTIDGHVVPEVGTWLPVATVLFMFGLCFWRRMNDPAAIVSCERAC
jgi:hypothetical protein